MRFYTYGRYVTMVQQNMPLFALICVSPPNIVFLVVLFGLVLLNGAE